MLIENSETAFPNLMGTLAKNVFFRKNIYFVSWNVGAVILYTIRGRCQRHTVWLASMFQSALKGVVGDLENAKLILIALKVNVPPSLQIAVQSHTPWTHTSQVKSPLFI